MTRTAAATYDIRQKLFWSLFALLTLIFICYATLLNKTIADVVFVEENQSNLVEMRSSLSQLEKEFLLKSADISMENAKNLGFVDENNPIFIKASSLRAEVSLGTTPR